MTGGDKMREDALGVIHNLRRARMALTHGLNRRLAPSGINIAQFGAMALIQQAGNPTMSVLTEKLGTTMGAVTSLIDRLVFSEYVERKRSKADRRIVRVALTPKGEEVLNLHIAWGTDNIVRFFDGVSAEDREIFIHVFDALVDSIEENVSED